MSSPPQRKYEGSRRSIEGEGLQFIRSVNRDDSDYVSFDSGRRYVRERSPIYLPPRLPAELRFESDSRDRFTYQSQSHDNVDLHNMRERLIAAETHCYGLENTVKNYEREIYKLRTIVNTLIDDFEVLQSRYR
jgi:hypothetical protein